MTTGPCPPSPVDGIPADFGESDRSSVSATLTPSVRDVETPAPPRPTSGLWLWAAVGFVAACGLALVGTRAAAVPVSPAPAWWFALPAGLEAGHGGALTVVFYGFGGLLVLAWVMVGLVARRGLLTTRRAWALLAAWGGPLVVAPPLFSRDLYSYVGQGLVARRGLDPYSVGATALGSGHLLASIPAQWRSTPAPYGPLFIAAARYVTPIFGSTVNAEVVALRCLELVGVALTMVYLPRLARSTGADPGTALWLGVLSPLALFGCIASGHNDALMVGLLIAGLALARTGRLVPGLVLLGLAMTVKIPAVLAIGFLGIAEYRLATGRDRLRVVAEVALVPTAVVAAVTWLSGYGWGWLAAGTLKVPTELRIAQTPSVAVGTFAFHVLHALGFAVGQGGTITVAQDLAALAAVALVAWLAWKVRTDNVVRLLGLAFLVVVVASPTVWPWYLLWGLVVLAATPTQRSTVLAAACALGMFMVMPPGAPVIRGTGYLLVVAGCAVGAVALVRHRWRVPAAAGPAGGRGSLARSGPTRGSGSVA